MKFKQFKHIAMTISPQQSPDINDRLRTFSSPALIRPSGKRLTTAKFTPQKYALNNANFETHEEEDLIENLGNSSTDKWLKVGTYLISYLFAFFCVCVYLNCLFSLLIKSHFL